MTGKQSRGGWPGVAGGEEVSSCSMRASSRTQGPRSSSPYRVDYSLLCLLFHLPLLMSKFHLSHSLSRATPKSHAGHLAGSPTPLGLHHSLSLPGGSALLHNHFIRGRSPANRMNHFVTEPPSTHTTHIKCKPYTGLLYREILCHSVLPGTHTNAHVKCTTLFFQHSTFYIHFQLRVA